MFADRIDAGVEPAEHLAHRASFGPFPLFRCPSESAKVALMKCFVSLLAGLAHKTWPVALLALLAVLGLPSCGGDDGAGVGTPSTSASSMLSGETTSTAPQASQPAPGSVTLRGDGLGVVAFGQNADDVIPIL